MRQPDERKIASVFDALARGYDRQMGVFERLLLGESRQWAVSHARGRVLELAVGTGLNLPHYGEDVSAIVGVDLSEGMLAVARDRVAELGLGDRVELRQGDVQRLDLPEHSVDTVLSTYTFCTIPDPALAAAQAYRVLVPGGRFVLAEHGPARSRIVRGLMRAVDPLSVRFGGDHLLRDPVPYLTEAGFTVDSVGRSGRSGVTFQVVAHR